MPQINKTKHKISVKAELEEECQDVPLQIIGSVPDWLSGTLVRNGPVDVHIGHKQNRHWFDGLAMLHAFTFQNQNVHYSNRFIRSEPYRTVFEKKSLAYQGFAQDPCRSLFGQLFTYFFHSPGRYIHNANVNVARLADACVALTETPLPVRFDPKTLETLGVLDYSDNLPKKNCFESAHPHRDLPNEETINYLVKYGKESSYCLYRMHNGSAQRELISEIAVEQPSYMHSFSITDNYIILTEYPFVVSPMDFLLKGKPFIDNFSWKPELGTHFLLIDRHKGHLVGKYQTDPFFSFHHINAYEENHDIIIDLIAYKDPSIIHLSGNYPQWGIKKEEMPNTELVRFKLTPELQRVTREVICEKTLELPRIHQGRYDGKTYRFAYAVDFHPATKEHPYRELCKVDMETKNILSWSHAGCEPGEPVFIARPGSKDEDDGIILAVVRNKFENHSFLLILDAHSFQELGRAIAPHSIPPGLHGQYFV